MKPGKSLGRSLGKSLTIAMALTFPLCATSVAVAKEGLKPIKEIFEPSGKFSVKKFMKVAVVQWAPPTAQLVKTAAEAEAIKQSNREALSAQIREAAGQGAKLIITSEFGIVGYPDIPELPDEDDNFQTKQQIAPYTEEIPGPSSKYFGALAKELGAYLQFGLVESDGKRFYNAAVAVGPDGNVLAVHRKVSLYHQEEDYLQPGKGGNTFETPAGTMGMLICADVYTPELLEEYKGKVQGLTLSTSWAQMNTGWSNFKSAAEQTGAYVLAANQPYFPDSGVIGPDGKKQSHIRQTRYGIAYGYLPIVK